MKTNNTTDGSELVSVVEANHRLAERDIKLQKQLSTSLELLVKAKWLFENHEGNYKLENKEFLKKYNETPTQIETFLKENNK